VLHSTPELKQQSKEWRQASSPTKMKFKQITSTQNIMCTLFWDRKGVLLADFLPEGSTINAGVYCITLKKLHHAIQNKLRAMLSWGGVMVHDNARPHTAAATENLIVTFGWEQFDHPPYSQVIFICFCILNPSLLSVGSTTTARSKKLLPRALHCRWHHSTMKGYKNCCNIMVPQQWWKVWRKVVYSMYMVCNIFFIFS
jgi:hypothetical protein